MNTYYVIYRGMDIGNVQAASLVAARKAVKHRFMEPGEGWRSMTLICNDQKFPMVP